MRTDWYDDAACRFLTPHEADVAYFNEGRGYRERSWGKRTRISLCGSCHVSQQCLRFGMLFKEHGYWGGTTTGRQIRGGTNNNEKTEGN